MGAEEQRLQEHREKKRHWKRWGPYLSARQWGTVREDYSANGDAWNYLPFEQAASRAYRWGEDGIFGFSDNHQRICFSFAFWNGRDPLLKERFFGLNNSQGNHGEDVKEYYYHLDALPTHAYMKALYKYPHGEYPYQRLREENQRRGLQDPEFELIDTGIFEGDRYFDLWVEYAKGDAEDVLVQLTIDNRGPKQQLHVLAQLWLRNTWSWKGGQKPCVIEPGQGCVQMVHPELGKRILYFEEGEPIFTENETNMEKLFGGKNSSAYVKDGFHEYVVRGKQGAVNEKGGTKSAVYAVVEGSSTVRLRFVNEERNKPFADFDAVMRKRREEADQFYKRPFSEERCAIQRQAFAGLLWNKQWYHYVVEEWLEGDVPPPPESHKTIRNFRWKHVYNDDILSMPDKWEYPWFAAWDLAFQCVGLALIDPDFAKRQLTLLTREWYMHPNGQLPAYEWNFDDVNPPVLAWAAWRVYKIEQRQHGREDREFLEGIFQKLIMNFTWWVNREDADGRNIFEGGFLGLDNISIFNRSQSLPEGGRLTQSDATSWMGMFCLNMWTIAVELASRESSYQDMASKFFEHFLRIADAINYQQDGSLPLWNEDDGFYYDLLVRRDGSSLPLRIHSLVGLIPLFAVATLDEEKLKSLPDFTRRFRWFLDHRGDLCGKVASMNLKGIDNRHLLAILDRNRLEKILRKMLDETEFLSSYGIRSVSQFHRDHPFVLQEEGVQHQIDYEPAESSSRLFGGNSNWRGPIWFPLNYLIIESLQRFHYYYGDAFKVECPTGSGKWMHLSDVAKELSLRLVKIFERDAQGRRPLHGDREKFQRDPHFRDHLFFNEYFHGDTGRGLGASHQTGWTALVAKLIQQSG